MTEINLMPDFARMFQLMLREVVNQGKAEYVFDCLPSDLQPPALRSIQRFLAPLNIAAHSMTSAEAVQQFRDTLNRIVRDIDQTAAEMERDLEKD